MPFSLPPRFAAWLGADSSLSESVACSGRIVKYIKFRWIAITAGAKAQIECRGDPRVAPTQTRRSGTRAITTICMLDDADDPPIAVNPDPVSRLDRLRCCARAGHRRDAILAADDCRVRRDAPDVGNRGFDLGKDWRPRGIGIRDNHDVILFQRDDVLEALEHTSLALDATGGRGKPFQFVRVCGFTCRSFQPVRDAFGRDTPEHHRKRLRNDFWRNRS